MWLLYLLVTIFLHFTLPISRETNRVLNPEDVQFKLSLGLFDLSPSLSFCFTLLFSLNVIIFTVAFFWQFVANGLFGVSGQGFWILCSWWIMLSYVNFTINSFQINVQMNVISVTSTIFWQIILCSKICSIALVAVSC